VPIEKIAIAAAALGPALMISGNAISVLGSGLSGMSGILGTVSGLFGSMSGSMENAVQWLGTFKGKLGETKASIASIFQIESGNGFLSGLKTVLSNISSAFSNILGVASSFGGQFLSILMKAFSFGAIGGLILVGFGLLESNFGTEIDQFFTDDTGKRSGSRFFFL